MVRFVLGCALEFLVILFARACFPLLKKLHRLWWIVSIYRFFPPLDREAGAVSINRPNFPQVNW